MYLIYGAGKIGNEFLNKCIKNEIKEVQLTDSNFQLWGTKVGDFKVLCPDEINYDKLKLVIISTPSIYYEEILNYLIKKIDRKKIVYYNDVLLLSPYDSLNLGNIETIRSFIYPGLYKREQLKNYFDENSFNDLDKFFYQKKHRLIHKWVHYTEAYDRFLLRFRGKDVKLLEIGVGKGGSLQMWKDYLGENAQIIGLDINPECKKFEERNIQIYIGDQGDRKFLYWLKEQIGKVDIIIDDGGHMVNQQINSFEELFEVLSDDGVYLCEDCHTSYWSEFNGGYKKRDTFIEYSKDMIDGLNAQYIQKNIPRKFKYNDSIKSLTFYDGMVFIEKRKRVNMSIAIQIDSQKEEGA